MYPVSLLAIRLMLWAYVNLPYLLCCLWVFYKPIRALGKGRAALLIASLAAYLLVPFLWPKPAGTHAMTYVLISIPACLALIPIASALSRLPLRTALYGLFSGVNALAALGLPILIIDQYYAYIQPYFILMVALLLSLPLSLFCYSLIKNHVLPYMSILPSLPLRYVDIAPAIYLALMLAFYAGNFSPRHLFWQCAACLLCLGGTYSAYSLSGKLLFQRMDNIEVLQRSNHLEACIQLQQAQYAALGEQIKQASAIRHDIRHHLQVLKQYIQDGDRDRLNEYLPYLQEEFAKTQSEPSICANSAVDAVARYYLKLARETGAQLDVRMEIPEDFAIPGFDLCIVIGNYLENAVEALRRYEAPGEKYIRLRAQQTGDNMFTLVAANSYQGNLLSDNGTYRSTKRYGMEGVGLSSIRSIVGKYKGDCDIKAEDGVFMLSILLFAQKEDSL